MLPIPVVILSVALFLALIANLALKPAFSTRLTAKCMIFAALAGLVIYGVGFAETTGSLAVSILRTPLSVTRMFVGINELSAIEGSTPVRTPMGVTIFWLVHMLAFFSTASAALVTIGAEVLRRLRLLLLRRGDLVILFGINDNTINVGKECLAQGSSVVFIAETADGTVIDDLNGMGMSVITGQDAVGSGKETIRTLHPLNRKITVFALDPSVDKNLYYALALKDALRNAGVAAENTRITLPGEEEIILNPRDRKAIGEKLVEAVNARLKNGRLRLAEETRDFAGGLILRRGSIEANCTVELLVELSQSELSAKVAEILFQ